MKKIIYIIGIFAILMSGCKEDWLSELSDNPNQPSNAPVQLLLPAALKNFAVREVGLNTRVSPWMGYASFAGGYSIDDNTLTYYVNQGNPSIWGYYDDLKNVDYMEKTAGELENMDYFVGIAKILKAYGFQKLVDAYGDVPYSEAFKGVENFFPSYDGDKSIYDANLADINEAINIIQNANAATEINPADNDIMFGGNMDRWLQFANTLKLRYLIRQSEVIGSGAQGEINNTLSIGFLEAGANVNPGFLSSAGKQSPLWDAFGTDPGGALHSDGYTYIRAGGAAMDFLKENNDPRLFYIYAALGKAPNKSGFFDVVEDAAEYVGVYYGDRGTATSLGTSGVSGIGNGILKGDDASVALISAAQSYFLQAEAVFRGWISGGDDKAKELYENGIVASFETLDVDDAQSAAEDYYSQENELVSWDASPDKLEAIITQKWISMAYTFPIEAWLEYRRTGYPGKDVLPSTMFTGYSRHMPNVLWYPKSETDTNQENYIAAGGPNTDPQSKTVFWDK